MKSTVNENSAWKKVGRSIYQLRYFVIAILAVISIFLGIYSKHLPGILDGDGFRTPGEYEKAKNVLEKEFEQSPDSLIIILERKKGVTDAKFQSEIERVVKEVQKEKNIEQFHHPLNNPSMKKKNIAYLSFLYNEKDHDQLVNLNNKFAKKVESLSNDSVKIGTTGFTIISDVMNKTSQKDLKKAEMIGVPIAFIVLFFAFGSLVASAIPIIIGMISILSTFGILAFIGKHIELSIFVLNVAPMIGLALSIDFALLFVSRYKTELQNHSTVKEAISVTFATAGRAIIFSGICVFIGLSALYFINIDLFRSVAISGAVVVLVSLFLSLTLLPAVLSALGKNINKGTLKSIANRSQDQQQAVWRKFANFVMKRPVIMTLTSLIILGLFVIPIRDVHLNIPTIDALPKDAASRINYEKYQKAFLPEAQKHGTISIVLASKDDFLNQDHLNTLENIQKKLEKDQNVYEVKSVLNAVNLNAQQVLPALKTPSASKIQPAIDAYIKNNKTYIQVFLNSNPKSEKGKQWVRDFEDKYKGKIEGLNYTVGGQVKFEQELFDEITDNILYGLLVIMVSTFIILMIAFRSIIIPIKAILMNVLSLSATFGIITWLFQGGNFGLPQSDIMLILPVFVFGLVFGLSMDYEVFLMSRMQELYYESGDNTYSTREGLVSTSRIITSAASIMIVITGAFAFTDMVPVKQMGIGIAIAIFLDATIVRLVLVPSLMQLFGKWNWWFPFRKNNIEERSKKVV
ncbi:MMPL family transporter [Arthrobacter citreus]|nr:MMPL family transporter [Arthrobacter citreus]